MLTGCEFFGPGPSENGASTANYINVTVKVRVQALFENRSFDTDEAFAVRALIGRSITIKIEKAGGENDIFYRTTDSTGFTEIVEATFKVYKEQPVTVFADFSLKNSREAFPFDYSYGC